MRCWNLLVILAPMCLAPPGNHLPTDLAKPTTTPDGSRSLPGSGTGQGATRAVEAEVRIDFPVLIANLGDDDPARRATAVHALTLVPADKIDGLKAAAMAARPLSPAQQEGLATAVTHLILAAQNYEPADPPSAVLGVTFGSMVFGATVEGAAMGLGSGTIGVTLEDRVPGFDAYTMLQNGDVIVALPGVPHMTSTEDFRMGVRVQKPGASIDITVFRDGKRMVVPVRLHLRPADYEDQNQDWRGKRLAYALQVWHDQWEEPLNAAPAAAK